MLTDHYSRHGATVRAQQSSAKPSTAGTAQDFAARSAKWASLCRSEANHAAFCERRVAETKNDLSLSEKERAAILGNFRFLAERIQKYAAECRSAAERSSRAAFLADDDASKTYAREARAHAKSAEAHAERFLRVE